MLQDDSRSIETKGTEGNQQGSPQVEGQTGPNDGQEADGTKEIVAQGRYFHICPAELGTPETDKEDAKDNHKRTWQCQEQGTFEEVFLHRLDIALKGEDKRWKSFDKLVNQGNLNRNKWEGQQIVHVKEGCAGDTDNSQNEGINGLDEENRSDTTDIIDHTASFKENLWDIVKV